jgi:hypothetical protein
VIDDELIVLAEELAERFPAAVTLERILLLDVLPGQLAPLPAELIPSPGKFLLLSEKTLARGEPLVVIHDLMGNH